MNFKKIIKITTITIVALVSLYGVGRLIDVSYGSFLFVDRQPYLNMQTKNSVRIKWQTPEVEIGNVAYGLSKDSLTNVLFEQTPSDKHTITIPRLKECTKYFYSVTSKSLKIDNLGRSFKTLCETQEKQRLWVIGDSGEKGKRQKRVYHSMLEYINYDLRKLDMWVLLGDNAYSSGTQKQFNKTLFKPYIELVKRYVPWAVIGNHDARRWAFYDIFDFPTRGESGGMASGNEEFYSVDNGNLHLVMLDSETVSLSKDSDMANWLRKDLAANTKPWVVVAFHSPPYTDGGHKSDSLFDSLGNMQEMRENFVPIFDEFGVDLVLNGHSHGYERSKLILNHTGKSEMFSKTNILQDKKTDYTKSLTDKKNSGTIYVVAGSSSKLDGATYNHPALPYSFGVMGSLILELTPTTLTSKFLTIDGKIADEFKITKEN
ncbi:serine/threonine protein phosphatase [Sulfurimonas aquatica]|uniref:Serine/threonine protein phosphatase n=1 Tax=Sulfurimonas aquatica TaxID=2672570 RepID=A0A975GCF9_9BACT|nr:metallophosphoesterase family protein [Sulfurimonas aquatica]QSZ41676.1 serine/threonine protein phosphatase [Sulfurimonas aquatica]